MYRKPPGRPAKIKRIAVIINPYFHYAREVLRGIFLAARAASAFEFYHFHFDGDFFPAVRAWKPGGLIVFEMDRRFRTLGVPNVCIGRPMAGNPTHRVIVNDLDVGKMAAEYFIGRRYRHLAFIHYPSGAFSGTRWQGFARAAKAAGCSCRDLLPAAIQSGWPRYWQTAEAEVGQWLKSLPRPLGLLCANDVIATHVLALCNRIGIAVPESISVLGVDDDDLTCMAAVMPLSTIQLPLHQIGAAALDMICRLIDAPTRQPETIQFPPTGVITRQSSDLTAIGDPDIAAAIAFIRAHAAEPIGVADLLRIVPVSRRALEQRFALIVGRSPHQEITRARLELARQRLLTTNLKLQEIATGCGFFDLGNFTRAFRHHTGYTPAAYRRAFRQSST